MGVKFTGISSLEYHDLDVAIKKADEAMLQNEVERTESSKQDELFDKSY